MFENIFEEAAKKAEANSPNRPDDYTLGGLLYCGNCNTPKQTVIEFLGKEKTVFCTCKCRQEELAKEEEERKRQEHLRNIANMRINGIHDENIRGWNFDKAEPSKFIDKAKTYCDKWSEMYENNIGLLFFGNVGTGKTFLAACIANRLIDSGVSVLMTNFSKAINDLTGFKEEDKNRYIASFNKYDLVIFDDLGVERQSDFANEQVFNIVDSRYKNGQPIIVTTNLSIEDLKNAKDMKQKRIYDRILEMTIPMKVDGASRREQLHRNKLELAKELLAD